MSDAAKTLVIIRMDGPEDRVPELLDNPTWQDIEAANLRLDGDSYLMLVLGIGNHHTSIGGGEREIHRL